MEQYNSLLLQAEDLAVCKVIVQVVAVVLEDLKRLIQPVVVLAAHS
jgi:hypothetical protein